jgi:gamma-glutamylaminecyclotransferase
MPLLFVYGTLKRGCKNHHLMNSLGYLGEARTAPGYRLYDLGDFPGMIADEAAPAGVTGEVWSADAAALARLDAFEGVADGLYQRVPVKLLAPFADQQVHTYLYARDPGLDRIGATWIEG